MAVTGTDITITTRTAKGSALTHAELDDNQTGLKAAIENHSHNEFSTEPGADGVGISSVAINGSGHLIVTYTDNSQHDAGYAVGPAGSNGSNGSNGSDGISITGVAINDSNHLIVTLSTGTTIDAGALPSGGGTGDMLKSTYDQDGDGHISYNDLTNKPTLGTAAAADAAAFADAAATTAALLAITEEIEALGTPSSGMTNPMTAAGDMIVGGVDGTPTRLAKGTDGQFLGYVGGTVVPVDATTASGSTDLLVAEIIVGTGTNSGKTQYVGGGSAVSSINISDLDGNAHGGYDMEIVWVAPATSDCTIRVRLNGASDDTGISDEWLTGYGASVIATTHAYFYAGFTAANRKGRSMVNIIPSGLETSLFSVYGGHDGSNKYAGVTVGDSVSVSNVTSIAVVATKIADGSASEFGLGSTVRIKRRK